MTVLDNWEAALRESIQLLDPTIDKLHQRVAEVLWKHNARLAGGFVARCIMNSQVASKRFSRAPAISGSVDLDFYVSEKHALSFITEISNALQCEPVGMHAAGSYKSFMRDNGILARTVLLSEHVSLDVMTCKRKVSNVIENFDLSGVCVSWDGYKIHAKPSIFDDMQVKSTYRWPKFVWKLHTQYYCAYIEGRLTKRFEKYARIGVEIIAGEQGSRKECKRDSGKCELCSLDATFGRWGTDSVQFCARHAPEDYHNMRFKAEYSYFHSRMWLNLTLPGTLWFVKYPDPRDFFVLARKSPYIYTCKAIYTMLAHTENGFFHWATATRKEAAEFFDSEYPGYKNIDPASISMPHVTKLRDMFSYLQELMKVDAESLIRIEQETDLEFEHFGSTLGSEHVLYYGTDWGELLKSATNSSIYSRIYFIHNAVRITANSRKFFHMLVDIAINNAVYKLQPRPFTCATLHRLWASRVQIDLHSDREKWLRRNAKTSEVLAIHQKWSY